MPKRITKRKGRLIQNLAPKPIDSKDIRQRNSEEGKFRIVAIEFALDNAWVVGNYATYREAKEIVDNMPSSNIDYYIHSDSSRVMYQRKRRDVNA